MASNEDVAFLRGLVQNGFLDPGQASQCTQVLDQRAGRGEKVTALQVAVELGMVDPRRLESEVKARTASRQMTAVQSAGMPPAPPPPPPPPATDSRRVARPGTSSGAAPRSPSGRHLRPPQGPAITPSQAQPRPGWGGASREDARPPGPGSSHPGSSHPGSSQSGRMLGTSREDARPPSLSLSSEDAIRSGASSAEQPAAPIVLAELTDYEPGAKLGAGPVGPSYLGRRKSDGAEVVLKLINPRFADHPELLDAVLRDLRAWTGYESPGATGPLALGTLGGQRVVVYPKLATETLEQVVARGPLAPRQAMQVVQLVARALVSIHGRGRAAGDIRASKVHWDGQRGVLTDLGLSRASCLAAGFGQYGLTHGHPAYLAPEVLQDGQRRPTPAADVYALGILLYQLIVGQLPYQGGVQEVLTQHLEAPLPPPPPGKVQVSAALAGLILRLTAKSPQARVPDARTAAEQLQALIERTPDTSARAQPRPVPAPSDQGPAAPAPAADASPPEVDELELSRLAEPEDQNAVSLDEWGTLAREEGQKVSTRWTRDKIAKPVKVGPKDWDEASVDEANEKASLELRAALQAAMASQEGAKKGASGRAAKPVRYVSGSGGSGAESSGALVKYVAALVLVVGGMGVMSLWPKKAPLVQPVASDHTPRPGYEAPTPEEVEAADAKRKRLMARLAEYTGEVAREAQMERFARALALLADPPDGLDQAPDFGGAVEQTRQLVYQHIDKYLIRTVEKDFQDFLRVGELEAAKLLLKGVSSWAKTRPPYEALERQLERSFRGKEAELVRLGKEGEEIPVERVRMQVQSLLEGGGGLARVHAGGGVVIAYKDAAALQRDLLSYMGPGPKLEPVPGQSGVTGVRVSVAKDKPTLWLHKLPLKRPIDVTLELVVLGDPPPTKGAKVAIVAGLSRKVPQGLGIAWGLSTVELSATHKALRELNSGITPEIVPGHRMSIEFTVERTGHPQRFELGGSLLDRDTHEREPGSQVERNLDELRGLLGIFVEGCEVLITGMEVRGLLDPVLLDKPEGPPPPASPRQEPPPKPESPKPPQEATPRDPGQKQADPKPAEQKGAGQKPADPKKPPRKPR